jgi:hypothetical protein
LPGRRSDWSRVTPSDIVALVLRAHEEGQK